MTDAAGGRAQYKASTKDSHGARVCLRVDLRGQSASCPLHLDRYRVVQGAKQGDVIVHPSRNLTP